MEWFVSCECVKDSNIMSFVEILSYLYIIACPNVVNILDDGYFLLLNILTHLIATMFVLFICFVTKSSIELAFDVCMYIVAVLINI